MMNPDTKSNAPDESSHWLDHLQNAIDRAFPSGRINSRTLAEYWDNIFQDAEIEQDNCDDCEREANTEIANYLGRHGL